jgi:hypothetical protein
MLYNIYQDITLYSYRVEALLEAVDSPKLLGLAASHRRPAMHRDPGPT